MVTVHYTDPLGDEQRVQVEAACSAELRLSVVTTEASARRFGALYAAEREASRC